MKQYPNNMKIIPFRDIKYCDTPTETIAAKDLPKNWSFVFSLKTA